MSVWSDLESAVRQIATTTWGAPFNSELVHNRQIDAYARLTPGNHVAIEVTTEKNINKIQDDLNKLTHVRMANFSDGFVSTECICVTSFDPTPAMLGVGSKINVSVLSVESFRAKYIPYTDYVRKRLMQPFGSAVDPESGGRDNKPYVKVYLTTSTGNDYRVETLAADLKNQRSVILTGEYGTGKSKCVEWLFETLSQTAWDDLQFPIAIDLRKCWGLKDRYEILKRHCTDLGLHELFGPLTNAYNEGLVILLIDGFDEVGVQIWTDNSIDLKRLRADALAGVRDLISYQKGGILVTGRDHYFDSGDELLSALGLINKSPLIVGSRDEFDEEELNEFLSLLGVKVTLPEWLPRKPLTCQFFVNLYAAIPEIADKEGLDAPQFWRMMLDAVCERESRIHSSFDPTTIKNILVSVAASTRVKPANVGPISLQEIQVAFEAVVGHAPIDQASVLLQRLPGLGRTSADSQDRVFSDTYLLDGLRATHLVEFIIEPSTKELSSDWLNAMGESGLLICGRELANISAVDDAIALVRKNVSAKNATLLMDIVCSVLASGRPSIDFAGCYIDGAYASVCNLSDARISNLTVKNSIIDKMVITGLDAINLSFDQCEIGFLEGVSSEKGMPDWIKGGVAKFSSLATTSRIRAAKLSNPHKALVTILRKTFFQRGAGRKEEALIRGLGQLVKQSVVDKIIGKLLSEGMITETRGREGSVYVPVRNKAGRAGEIMSELTLSDDPIWHFVSALD